MEKISKNNLYQEIKSILEEARKSAYRAVNFSMVLAYYQIGKLIVEEEQEGKKRAGYGEALLADLSKRLTRISEKDFQLQVLKITGSSTLPFLILKNAPHCGANYPRKVNFRKAPHCGANRLKKKLNRNGTH